MNMTLIMADGKTELNFARYEALKINSRGFDREAVRFIFKESDHTYEELKSIFTNENLTEKMTVPVKNTIASGISSDIDTVIELYIVPCEPLIQPAKMVVDSSDNVEEDVFIIVMGKLIKIEEELRKLGINMLEK